MTRFFEFLKRQPMMTAVLALMIAMAGVGLPQESYLTRAVLRVLLTGTMLFLLSLISGEKTLSQGDNQTGYVIRQLMGFLILAAIAGVLTAVGTVVQGQVRPGILLRLVTLLLLFLFVGLFEELCFRAVLNDAMICQFRSSRAVFVWSAVFSSLIFGAVHVIGSPLTGAVEVLEAVLKTLSTAIVGFAFLILYWKTRPWGLRLSGVLPAGARKLRGDRRRQLCEGGNGRENRRRCVHDPDRDRRPHHAAGLEKGREDDRL